MKRKDYNNPMEHYRRSERGRSALARGTELHRKIDEMLVHLTTAEVVYCLTPRSHELALACAITLVTQGKRVAQIVKSYGEETK